VGGGRALGGLPYARRRSPRGVAWKPAPSRRVPKRDVRAEAPLTRSTVTVPRDPARAASASASAAVRRRGSCRSESSGGELSEGEPPGWRARPGVSCRRAPCRGSARRPPARPGSPPCVRACDRRRWGDRARAGPRRRRSRDRRRPARSRGCRCPRAYGRRGLLGRRAGPYGLYGGVGEGGRMAGIAGRSRASARRGRAVRNPGPRSRSPGPRSRNRGPRSTDRVRPECVEGGEARVVAEEVRVFGGTVGVARGACARVAGRGHAREPGLGQGLAPLAGVGRRAQPVHRAVHRELRGAEPLHHIAAAGLAALLEGGQDAVDGGEAALHALRGDRAPGDHAVPVEQGTGQGVGAHGGVGLKAGEQ
jgi:hypothetical protein